MPTDQLSKCLAWIVVLMSFWVANQSPAAVLPELKGHYDEVESYLETLGLDELLLFHLERRLEKEPEVIERKRIAKRLAKLYTSRLVSPSTSYEQSQKWQLKAQQLIQVYPSLEDPVLRMAIFHARYQALENEFESWWQSGLPAEQRQSQVDAWRQLVRELLQLIRRMEKERRELSIDENLSDRAGYNLQLRLASVDNVVLHAQYLVGWASYFRSIAQPSNAAEWLTMSDTHFRRFLQIEPNKLILELGPRWFDFSNGWTSRALIGMAVSKLAQEQFDVSNHCFRLAQAGDDSRATDLVDVWRLRSLAYAGRFEDAREVVEAKSRAKSTTHAGYWKESVDIGVAISGRSADLGNRLLRAGLAGLARSRQVETIIQLIDEHNIDLQPVDFLTRWISGFIAFVEAEKSADRNLREQAKIRLTQAIDTQTGNENPEDLARCQFLLANIRFLDHEFALAEPMFEAVVNALQESDRATAAQAHWKRIESLVELSKFDRRRSSQAFAVMEQMLRRFPDSSLLRRMDFQRLKLEIQSVPDEEAIRRLQRIGAESDHYTDANYEIAQRRYQMWLAADRAGEETAAELLQRFIRQEELYRQDSDASDPKKLRLLLLVIHAKIKSNNAETGSVERNLATAKQFAESLRSTHPELYQEYRFFNFRYLQGTDSEAAAHEARWLALEAAGTPYESSAMVFLAQVWERDNRSSQQDAETTLEGMKIYQRLSELSGSESEDLKKSVNARISLARLADLNAALGNWNEAERQYEQLLLAFPNSQNYLLGMARSKKSLGRQDLARPLWQRLAVGVEAGTAAWYESKYELARCLASEDADQAAQLVRQTMQLSPEMPSHWKSKFDDLNEKLEEDE